MKVAYNKCLGGFGLSPIAETEYRKKKGITLTWYKGVGKYPYKSYKKVHDISSIQRTVGTHFAYLDASNADLGEEIKAIPDENFFGADWHGEENRADPDLIEVIERLGEKANGDCASLAIKEIPDGAQFEITEHDGFEEVVPPRMSWWD